MRRYVSLLLAALVCICLVGVWPVSEKPGVTLWNAQQIRRGMTVQDVELLMGGPCDSIENRKMWFVAREWKADGIEIEVLFDGSSIPKVEDGIYHTPGMGDLWEYLDEVHKKDESVLGKLRVWWDLLRAALPMKKTKKAP
jgi:hypothetical protein